MRRITATGLLVVAALSSAGCGNVLDRAAATVRGEPIPAEEIEADLEAFRGTQEFKQLASQQSPESVSRQFEQATLARLIRGAVLEPEAQQRGIEVTQKELDHEIENIKSQLPSEKAFDQALKERSLTLADVEDLVSAQLIEQELRREVTADVAPTTAELRARYKKNIDQYKETRTQHILVQDAKLAGKLSNRLQAAPEDKVGRLFEKLAAKHSEDTSNAKKAGDLGFQPAGALVPQFESAAAGLEVGEVSDPVRTQFGWHVIRLLGRRTRPFQSVRPELAEEARTERAEEVWQSFLEDAYARAEVEVDPRYGELDPSTGQILNPTAEDVPGAEAPPEATPLAPAPAPAP